MGKLSPHFKEELNKKEINLIILLSLIGFFMYLFINLLFPFANTISVVFLAITVGLTIYSLINKNYHLLYYALVSIILSIFLALWTHPFFHKKISTFLCLFFYIILNLFLQFLLIVQIRQHQSLPYLLKLCG